MRTTFLMKKTCRNDNAGKESCGIQVEWECGDELGNKQGQRTEGRVSFYSRWQEDFLPYSLVLPTTPMVSFIIIIQNLPLSLLSSFPFCLSPSLSLCTWCMYMFAREWTCLCASYHAHICVCMCRPEIANGVLLSLPTSFVYLLVCLLDKILHWTYHSWPWLGWLAHELQGPWAHKRVLPQLTVLCGY